MAEKTLESPLDCKEIQPVHLKEISTEYSLEGLTLKLQYFGHLMLRTDSLEKTLMLGRLKAGEGGYRGWDGWMTSPTQWTWIWVSARSWWWTGKPGVLQSMGSQKVGHNWVTELNWTECGLGEEWEGLGSWRLRGTSTLWGTFTYRSSIKFSHQTNKQKCPQ